MSDLRDLFAPDLVAALERFVDERVSAAIAERPAFSEPTWLSLAEAAEYKRVSLSTIARLRKQGRLRSSHVGRRVLVLREDLDHGCRVGNVDTTRTRA